MSQPADPELQSETIEYRRDGLLPADWVKQDKERKAMADQAKRIAQLTRDMCIPQEFSKPLQTINIWCRR